MATLTLDIKSELPRLVAWSAAAQKQLPFATSQALNAVAFDARTAINISTSQFFQNPNRFTQTAFFVQRSTKRNLEAIVFAEAGRGKDRARYLKFGIQGGQRVQKGFERKFLAEVVGTRRVPANAQLVPTSLVKLNAQGNVSLATIKRIQKGLATKGNGTFFTGTPKGGDRPPGIYRRSKGQLFPYFIAIEEQARYQRRLPIGQTAGRVTRTQFGGYLRTSLSKALETAR